MSADRYITFLCSLPPHGELFKLRQPPISEPKLRERLRMLEPEDSATLSQLLDLLSWAGHPMAQGDAVITARARALAGELRSDTLKQVMAWCMEVRTLLAAMRRRKRGEAPPDPLADWGYGRWKGQIARAWDEPDFRLGGVFPWAGEAARLLDQGDPLGLERLLLGESWKTMERFQQGHYFDFEAVVLYMLRWTLTRRWTSYSGAGAVRRFHALVDQGLGQ